jgi:hypothetical protein
MRRTETGAGGGPKALPEVAGEVGTAVAKAAAFVGKCSERQRFVQRRRRAESGGAAQRRSTEVLESSLESETLSRPGEIIFVLEIRVEEGQTTGRSRPAGGFAKHAMKPPRHPLRTSAGKIVRMIKHQESATSFLSTASFKATSKPSNSPSNGTLIL